ncbi:MAG: hypothetical protein RDV48_06870 [Candidatus Eremiobacteraeota bacterium]|nr:hypothetical protein [Candidatus Eremiobacteraeota bacterium]
MAQDDSSTVKEISAAPARTQEAPQRAEMADSIKPVTESPSEKKKTPGKDAPASPRDAVSLSRETTGKEEPGNKKKPGGDLGLGWLRPKDDKASGDAAKKAPENGKPGSSEAERGEAGGEKPGAGEAKAADEKKQADEAKDKKEPSKKLQDIRYKLDNCIKHRDKGYSEALMKLAEKSRWGTKEQKAERVNQMKQWNAMSLPQRDAAIMGMKAMEKMLSLYEGL